MLCFPLPFLQPQVCSDGPGGPGAVSASPGGPCSPSLLGTIAPWGAGQPPVWVTSLAPANCSRSGSTTNTNRDRSPWHRGSPKSPSAAWVTSHWNHHPQTNLPPLPTLPFRGFGDLSHPSGIPFLCRMQGFSRTADANANRICTAKLQASP